MADQAAQENDDERRRTRARTVIIDYGQRRYRRTKDRTWKYRELLQYKCNKNRKRAVQKKDSKTKQDNMIEEER
jgi:hypothetical protein